MRCRGGGFRRGEFRRANFAVKKSGAIFVALCVTNNFTVNSDASEHCEFRCAAVYQADKDVFVSIQSPPGNKSKLQDSRRWRKFPPSESIPAKVVPWRPSPPPAPPVILTGAFWTANPNTLARSIHNTNLLHCKEAWAAVGYTSQRPTRASRLPSVWGHEQRRMHWFPASPFHKGQHECVCTCVCFGFV